MNPETGHQEIAGLAEEARLNALLDAWRVATPDAALVGRIVAAAPGPRARAGRLSWLAPMSLGAGLAAACAAGVFVGAQAARTNLDRADAVVAVLDPTAVGEGV